MCIDAKVAQKLLKKIMDNIEYKININIFNENGEIIASGDKNRIGKIHLGALEAIKNSQSINYFDFIDNDIESSRPGINMPIIIDNEIIGVVGVTGNPNEIKLISNIVKMITEILIEREIGLDKTILEQNSIHNYIYKIISKECIKYSAFINMWAENNNYHFNIERVVCILQIEENSNYEIKKVSEYFNNKLKEIIYLQDIVAYIGNKQFIIIKSFDKASDKRIFLNLFFESLKEKIKINIEFSVFCGSAVNNLESIHNSFEQANFLANYIRLNKNKIYFIEDYILDYIILNEGYKSSNMILKNTINIINKNSSFKEIIITMCKYDMNINKTAQKLNMHRNTIIYRMKKIKEILHLDPINNHIDRLKFYILSTLLKH